MATPSSLSITLALVGLMICGGCQSFTSSTAKGAPTSAGSTDVPAGHGGPEVEIVRNGVLALYDSTTVGKAFEGTFQNAKWSSFETPKGAVVVQFDGTVTSSALKQASLYSFKAEATLRNGCIASLGLKSTMEQESELARKEEQQYNATMAEIETRRQDAQRSRRSEDVENLNKEWNATWAAHNETVKAQKELDNENEAKIQPCMSTTPIPVQFQFLLSADKKTFEINYVDQEVFGDAKANALDFIYR
jgi:hypothetical protein